MESGEGEARLCCMCGDVGFSADIRPCPACSRVQHTYCSRMYPKITEERWRCEWCLCSDNQQQQQLTTTEAMTKKHKGGKRGGSFRLSPETDPVGVTAAAATAASSPQPSPKKPRQKRGGVDIEEDGGAAGRKDGRASMSVTTPIGCDHRERWRNTSPSPRVVGRRYKLLADVHC